MVLEFNLVSLCFSRTKREEGDSMTMLVVVGNVTLSTFEQFPVCLRERAPMS